MAEWEIKSTKAFDEWFEALMLEQQKRIVAVVGMLKEEGPALSRPLADSVKGSRHPNMKELRSGTVRILFAFDPERNALLLIGGDKRDRWEQWYREVIPLADEMFEQHLRRVRRG